VPVSSKRAALGSSDDPYPARFAEIRRAAYLATTPPSRQLTFAGINWYNQYG
jgi:hypothetical protein